MAELDDTERQILRLAGARYRFEANRERAALEQFGLASVPFYVRVNALLDDPAAELAEPEIVHRLRRLRDGQRRLRRAS